MTLPSPDPFWTLAVEFSSAQLSAAVVDLSGGHGLTLGEAVESGSRSSRGLALVEAALREAKLERERIQCLAVGLGPGSYTGIRAAVSMAQGWQLANKVKLLGISSADCLAAQAQLEGLRGRVDVVIDAQRHEFYVAGFEISNAGAKPVEPLRITTMEEVRTLADGGSTLVGPEITKWFPQGRLLYPRAATLGELARGRTDFVTGEKLVPIYLRETRFVKAPPPRVLPAR